MTSTLNQDDLQHEMRPRIDRSHGPLSSNTRLRAEDSWIEISSRSSSSTILTASSDPRRVCERPSRQPDLTVPSARSASAAGSSQDEYEESSSESDAAMGSSNDEIVKEEKDDDRTALAAASREVIFTPQPNAFSHPPTSQLAQDSYFPQIASTPASIRRERRPHLQRQRTSGSYQPDHDAALRASLTTLLSCAAAVRPKEEKISERATVRRTPIQPTTLRLVQDLELESGRPAKQPKRKSRESSKDRSAKKLRAAKPDSVEIYSPIAGWIISAGVIMVVSAISFSAGYYMGRIDGRIEGQAGLTSASCGEEVMKSSRAVNWTRSSTRITT